MKIKFTEFNGLSNWVSGKVGEYDFGAKLFDKGSDYGIDGGRISKLTILKGSNWEDCIVNYDRGWDVRPEPGEITDIYEKVKEFLENAPERF